MHLGVGAGGGGGDEWHLGDDLGGGRAQQVGDELQLVHHVAAGEQRLAQQDLREDAADGPDVNRWAVDRYWMMSDTLLSREILCKAVVITIVYCAIHSLSTNTIHYIFNNTNLMQHKSNRNTLKH